MFAHPPTRNIHKHTGTNHLPTKLSTKKHNHSTILLLHQSQAIETMSNQSQTTGWDSNLTLTEDAGAPATPAGNREAANNRPLGPGNPPEHPSLWEQRHAIIFDVGRGRLYIIDRSEIDGEFLQAPLPLLLLSASPPSRPEPILNSAQRAIHVFPSNPPKCSMPIAST